MIEVNKILTNKYDSGVNCTFRSSKRGHSLKLVNNRYHYHSRNFFLHLELLMFGTEQLTRNSNISRYNRHFQKKTINFGNTRIYYMIIRLS